MTEYALQQAIAMNDKLFEQAKQIEELQNKLNRIVEIMSGGDAPAIGELKPETDAVHKRYMMIANEVGIG